MSWDIFLFNTKQKVETIDELDDDLMEPIDFCAIFEKHFSQIEKDENHRSIKGRDFSIDYFTDDEQVETKVLHLYGEYGLYELIMLAREYDWQMYDTYLGVMIDLDNPQKNGYENFGQYIRQITGKYDT